MLQRYLYSRYAAGGRGELVRGRHVYDCYGLARCLRHRVHGRPLRPPYGGVDPEDVPAMTRIARAEIREMYECRPRPGAMAAVWHGALCIHVGVVTPLDGALGVLETTREAGPSWASVNEFESRYLMVSYHDDD